MDDKKYVVEMHLTRREYRIIQDALISHEHHLRAVYLTVNEYSGQIAEEIQQEEVEARIIYNTVKQAFTLAFGQNRLAKNE